MSNDTSGWASALAGVDMTQHDKVTSQILAVNIAFMVVVVSIVSVRLFSRLMILGHWGWDDSTITHSLCLLYNN